MKMEENEMSGCFRVLGPPLRCVLWFLCWPALAGAQIDLSLEPAGITVQPGEAVALQLWARAASALPVDGADVVIRWDENLLSLQGKSDAGGLARWQYSGFPETSPLNADLTDGEALYECLSSLAAPSPQTDILLTTLQFVALQGSGVVSVTIPVEGDTYVASDAEDALDAVTGATITIVGTGPGGGGSGGDPGDGETGDDDGGTTTQPGDDGTTTQPGDDDTESPDDGSEQGGDDNANIAGETPVRTSLCGAGAVESLMMTCAGLAFVRVLPRKRRGAHGSMPGS